MSTQPKREEEFDKEFVGEGKIDPITAIGIKNWIKQVEHQTILRCVEILEGMKLSGYSYSKDALDTAINKLQDLTK